MCSSDLGSEVVEAEKTFAMLETSAEFEDREKSGGDVELMRFEVDHDVQHLHGGAAVLRRALDDGTHKLEAETNRGDDRSALLHSNIRE